MKNKQRIKNYITKNYTNVANKNRSDCCCCGGNNLCCGGNSDIDVHHTSLHLGYSDDEISSVPIESNMGLGCGNPTSIAQLKEGEKVLDLGCGGGFDCFLACRKVGDNGYVIGVDMTWDMINLARKNKEKNGYKNVDFRLGEIEHLPLENEAVDVIISNCVINLSTDKEQVFREAYRVLKKGGRLSISDVVATALLPKKIKEDLSMMAGCIAGAEHVDNIKDMLYRAGFKDILLTPKSNSREIISAWTEGTKAEDYVSSYIIKATKQ